MPDFRGLGRQLAKGTEALKAGAGTAVRKLRADDEKPEPDSARVDIAEDGTVDSSDTPQAPAPDKPEPENTEDLDERADDAEVEAETSRLRALLDKARPAPGPVTDRWALGLGDLLADHPKVPKRLRGLVRKANRFGGVAISPEGIEFDGDEVEWSEVTEVRTRNLVEYLLSDAVDQQLEAVPLPPFPGRARLLDAVGRAMLTLVVAASKEALEKRDVGLRVPAEVEYRGVLRRRKTLAPGMLAALVLADPAVNGCVLATAEARNVPVRAGDDELMDDVERRVAELKVKLAALEAKLGRLRLPGR